MPGGVFHAHHAPVHDAPRKRGWRSSCAAGALVTGEYLGQVASQTMQALAVSEDVTTLPVLRPLIGLDKEEIVRISRPHRDV